jgi:hypothetical protein
MAGGTKIRKTWYWTFAKMLLEGSPAPEQLFDNISIVCFNYDRCIEHYLICELMRAYCINRKLAAALVDRLRIWHPYGTIAPLDTQAPTGIAFGEHTWLSGSCFHLVDGIRTLTEQHEDRTMIEAIRRCTQSADTIVFLGFGYYRPNLALIHPFGPTTNIAKIIGTGHGLPDDARRVVEHDLRRWSKGNKGDMLKIEIPNMTCADLLDNYRMRLTA